jgi:methyl-accepting chemotaxis protein
MPCTKCKEGKYKWGKTGSCEYDTKEECEKANPKNYNKMRPTPLGKKSYEEYAKELKEYNLSTQRFNFNDVKTLDRLSDQAMTIYDAMPEKTEIEMTIDRVSDEQSDIDYSNEKLKDEQELAKEYEDSLNFNKEELKALQSTIKDDTQEFKAASKRVKEWTNEVKAATKNKNAAEKKANSMIKEVTNQVAKAKKIASDLDKAMTGFDKAAKALGVNVSSKLNEYDSVLSDIKYVANFKIPKL